MDSAEPRPGGAGKEGIPGSGAGRPRGRGPDRDSQSGAEGEGAAQGKREPEESSHRRRFEDTLSDKAARKLKARREGDRGIWFGLGMMGLVGWSVAIPTVAGIAVGVWLDRRSPDPGGISWTLTGLVVGVFLGCLNAWIWVDRELEDRQ